MGHRETQSQGYSYCWFYNRPFLLSGRTLICQETEAIPVHPGWPVGFQSSALSADTAGTGVPVGCPIPETPGITMSLYPHRLGGTVPQSTGCVVFKRQNCHLPTYSDSVPSAPSVCPAIAWMART